MRLSESLFWFGFVRVAVACVALTRGASKYGGPDVAMTQGLIASEN